MMDGFAHPRKTSKTGVFRYFGDPCYVATWKNSADDLLKLLIILLLRRFMKMSSSTKLLFVAFLPLRLISFVT